MYCVFVQLFAVGCQVVHCRIPCMCVAVCLHYGGGWLLIVYLLTPIHVALGGGVNGALGLKVAHTPDAPLSSSVRLRVNPLLLHTRQAALTKVVAYCITRRMCR